MPLTTWQATVDPCLHQRLLDFHKQGWFNLWCNFSFLLGPGTQQVLLVPFKSVSPVLWKFCNEIPLAFKVKFSGGSHSLCQNPGWEICCAPRTFAPVRELLWYSCSPVCGLSAQQLYSGVNGNLLQEDLCYTPCPPVLLQLFPRQVTVDLCFHMRHSYTQRRVWLWLLWRSLLNFLGPGAHKILFAPSKYLVGLRFDFKWNCAFLPSCWCFSFSLFGGIQHSPVNGC